MQENCDSEFEIYTEHYGEDEFQLGDLYLPKGVNGGTVCLFHGGFWKMPYDRFQLSDLSRAIAKRGFAVWNIEYRRTGWSGGGYPGTFCDAVEAVNALLTLKKQFSSLNLTTLYLAGHSAGGHLALWLGSRGRGVTQSTLSLSPSALIGLAPVTDLLKCYSDKKRAEFVVPLLNNTTPANAMADYLSVSPVALPPNSLEKLVIHGDADEAVPFEESEVYVAVAKARGEKADLVRIHGGAHMDFVDPDSAASQSFIDWMVSRRTRAYSSSTPTAPFGP